MSEQHRRRRHQQVVWRQQQKHFGEALPRHSCSGLQDMSLEISPTNLLFRPPADDPASETTPAAQPSPAALMQVVHEAAMSQSPPPVTVLQSPAATITEIIHRAAQTCQASTERAS